MSQNVKKNNNSGRKTSAKGTSGRNAGKKYGAGAAQPAD